MGALKIAKRHEGLVVTFAAVQSNGALRPGLVAGDFTVTVRNPGDTVSLAPTVAEMASGIGVYAFTIPASFFQTHGTGDYAATVQIDSFAGPSSGPHVRAVLHDMLHVSETDFDGPLAAVATVAAGSTATVVRTTRTEADNFWNGAQLVVFGPAGTPAVRNVDDYAFTNGAFTVAALPFTPSAGARVYVLARTGSVPLDTAALADAVWDEVLSGHLGAGSAGAIVSRILQLAQPDVVVDKIAGTITLKDRTTGAVLVVYNVTGTLDTRVEELDG